MLTYKYSILATNTDEITSPRRDFTGYMQEYFDRLGKLVSANQKTDIRTWTTTILKNEQKIRNDKNFKALENAFWAAEGGKFQFGG